eukprot:CAMPEP_0201537996 /NCGR_PEP_ID=MMETSP0161_2-20130828/66331_1 /ASSEMBLY_ACC=CAM_ASM_000251 /TAXON_ID=180227 /ORGANISM="Neoparamoeba aestuarina, Strain SoJaBio B1-5/56/2" /LENGTH=75 /DNA_ID=CAMNT_0047944595 /DNA_START=41 /DNA_END=265 /DNA_ORIENTATION=+
MSRSSEKGCPSLPANMIKYLQDRALITPGLFQKNLAIKQVEELQGLIDSGELTSFDHIEDPHVVASLLKQWLIAL